MKHTLSQETNTLKRISKVLTREQYRSFEKFCLTHGREMYENKFCYSVNFNTDADTFTVELADNSIYTWEDILNEQ